MDSMMEIIEWLVGIERKAGKLYYMAAEYFRDDNELRDFLEHCEKDESWHYHVMVSAADFVGKNSSIEASISLDDEIRRNAEGPLNNALGALEAGKLTREELAGYVLKAEFSEWNHLFIYVVKSLLKVNRLFKSSASVIQGHLKSIENFFKILPDGEKFLSSLHKIPRAIEERILVVDDREANVDLVEAMLDDYKIDKAYNGREALDMVRSEYYRVIISDVEMPVLDGIGFLDESEKEFPGIRDRFIFFTGDHSSERLSFFNSHKLNYLLKPATVHDLREKTFEVMDRNKGIKKQTGAAE